MNYPLLLTTAYKLRQILTSQNRETTLQILVTVSLCEIQPECRAAPKTLGPSLGFGQRMQHSRLRQSP
jgi:hypothetical protein